jgi:hypothetical protein
MQLDFRSKFCETKNVLFEKPIGFTSKPTDFFVSLTVVKKGKFGLKMSKIMT